MEQTPNPNDTYWVVGFDGLGVVTRITNVKPAPTRSSLLSGSKRYSAERVGTGAFLHVYQDELFDSPDKAICKAVASLERRKAKLQVELAAVEEQIRHYTEPSN